MPSGGERPAPPRLSKPSACLTRRILVALEGQLCFCPNLGAISGHPVSTDWRAVRHPGSEAGRFRFGEGLRGHCDASNAAGTDLWNDQIYGACTWYHTRIYSSIWQFGGSNLTPQGVHRRLDGRSGTPVASMVADGGRWEDFRLKWSPAISS